MDEGGKGLFHADGGAAPADVAGEGQKLLHVDHGAVLIAADAGRHLQVHFRGTGHYAYEQTVFVSPQDQGLEHTVQVFSQLLRHVGGLQMLLVHLIGDQGVGDSGGVQQPGGICFLNLHSQM